MQQMNIPENMQVTMDFERPDMPKTAKELRPAVWMDGTEYCCLLGPDPQQGIFGCGPSPEDAIVDWDKNLKQRMETATEGDEVAQYVMDTLKRSKDDVW